MSNGATSIPLSSTTGLPLVNPGISSTVIPATFSQPLEIRFTDTASSTPLFKASIVPPNTLQVLGPGDVNLSTNPVLKVEPLG